MRRLGLALVLMACGGGGKGGGDIWDVRVVAFAEAICINDCVPVESQDECIVDVFADMDQARVEVGAAGEAACIECMRVKTELLPEIEAQGCQSTETQDAEVEEACGIADDACAGFP